MNPLRINVKTIALTSLGFSLLALLTAAPPSVTAQVSGSSTPGQAAPDRPAPTVTKEAKHDDERYWSSVTTKANHAVRSQLGNLSLASDADAALNQLVSAGIERMRKERKNPKDVEKALNLLKRFSRDLRDTAKANQHTEITLADFSATKAKCCYYPICC